MTKRLLIVLVSALIYNTGLAQSRITYSFDIAPIYSHRYYKLKDSSKETNNFPAGDNIFEYFKDYYQKEKPGLGAGLAMGIQYNLSEKSSIKTGLGYKITREKILMKKMIGKFEYTGGFVPIFSDELLVNHNSYHYLSVPIDFEFKLFTWNKSSFGLVTGTDFDFLIGHKIRSIDYSTVFYSDLKYNFASSSSLAINLKGGLFLDYKIRKNLSLYIQPEFAIYLTENIKYDIQFEEYAGYSKINQYNYYGQINIGIKNTLPATKLL